MVSDVLSLKFTTFFIKNNFHALGSSKKKVMLARERCAENIVNKIKIYSLPTKNFRRGGHIT